MKLTFSALSVIAAQLAAYANPAKAVDADSLDGEYSCVGTFIYGRHNDRTAKPSNVLTTLGQVNQVKSGNFHRMRYFGLDGDDNEVDSDFKIDGLNAEGYYVYGETYAQSPASSVIQFSQMSFLQGLYPSSTAVNTVSALETADDSGLSNGTQVVGPLDGYQYVFMDVEQTTSPNNIWIQGDVNCPASDNAIDAYYLTDEFLDKNESTWDFYQSLQSVLDEKKWPSWKLNYGNAMSLYDYMWVNYIHNEDLAADWNDSLIFDVKVLADQAQWGISYDSSNLLNDFTIGGQTFLGAVLNYLNATKTAGSPYINYFTGSYNTMYMLWALMELNKVSDNFTGMPEYGATLVWDLLLKDNTTDDYYVQFSFRNGTYDYEPITAYPIFGTNDTLMSWDDFVENIQSVSIGEFATWCNTCNATVAMCVPYQSTYEDAESLIKSGANLTAISNGDYSSLSIDQNTDKSNLTLAAAGGIGAGVTIGVFLILGGFLYLVMRNKKDKEGDFILPVSDKDTHSTDQPSTSSTL